MTGSVRGEAILVASNFKNDSTERVRVMELMTGDVDPEKQLAQGRGGGLEKLLLDVIAFSGNIKMCASSIVRKRLRPSCVYSLK